MSEHEERPAVDHEALRKLAEKAAPRPWFVIEASNGYAPMVASQDSMAVAETFDKPHLQDAELIVAAVNTLPALLAENAALRKEVGALRQSRVELADEAQAIRNWRDRMPDLAAERDAARTAHADLVARVREYADMLDDRTRDQRTRLAPDAVADSVLALLADEDGDA